MRNAGGYARIDDPDATLIEIDTFSCAHCNRVTHVKPQARPEDMGGMCKQCMGLICDQCVGKGCDPLEEKLKREEARGIALRSYGLG